MNCIQGIFQRQRKHKDGTTAKQRLPVKQKISHGVGHILNDLAASVWFSYLIIYLTKVAGLSNRNTGLVVFLGQIADAVCTPFIGILCDRTVCRYGRRKIWHLIGTVLTSISFPMLFIRILPEGSSETLKVCYFVGIAAVFQFGWGSVQISHLSLIPEICHRNNERVELNAIRSALTFVCGIYVYTVTWILLGENSDAELLPSAWKQFMYLSLIIVGTGNVFNLFFHAVTKEPKSEALLKWQAKQEKKKKPIMEKHHCNGNSKVPTRAASGQTRRSGATPTIFVSLCEGKDGSLSKKEGASTDSNVTFSEQAPLVQSDMEKQPLEIIDRSTDVDSPKVQYRTKKEWLKDPTLYKVAVIYMCTRLVVNIAQSYLPIYLTDTMEFQKEAIAYFPLVVLISGVLASLCVKPLTKKLGSKITYCIGSIMALGACLWYFVQSIEGRNAIYATTVLMGTGGSVMLVTALSLISELIGHDKKSGAFIYGAISFTDKLSSGAVIAVIQALNPRKDPDSPCPSCGDYVRYIQSIAPGAAAAVALFTAIFFFDSIFVCKRKVEKSDAAVQVGYDEEFAKEEKEEDDEAEQHIILHDTQESKDSNHNLSQSDTIDDTANFPSIEEERNLFDEPAPVWCQQQSAQRLANQVLPPPDVDRQSIV